ncbi:uncharacterized protein PRCAT00006104001 [Priceomyces carsonii]|uniref:uncharacterized protein n=1 Tax=Priceomyces carsonii TaxID=28549 RepID=UPI002EDA1F0D|nr:unnamed protein product [Priceomyces carsonii]
MNFPPSSPLLDRDVKHELVEKVVVYPTPHPSSTTGRESSPAPLEKSRKALLKINFNSKENKDFDILLPRKEIMLIPLSNDSNGCILIGRSSKSCDYCLSKKDKTISRVHLSIIYSSEQIIIHCIGFNGFAIKIPRTCLIYSTSIKNNYIIYESDKPLKEHKPIDSKTIKLAPGVTEFCVSKDESITLPRFHNVVIEIRGKLILLNPLEEEDDYDDDVVEVETATPTRVIHNDTPKAPVKLLKDMADDLTPSRPPKTFKIHQDDTSNDQGNYKEISKTERETSNAILRDPKPLDDKTNMKRKKKVDASKDPKRQKPNQSCIVDISNISEINNILINHLAFSRLSSTPASFLNSISAVTSKLTLEQIRVVLHNIKSIGTIYREGKDAAGKPLDEEYYYMPENDDDIDRVELVQSIRGHGGLRSCRKTHKQYYWKKPSKK